MYGRDGAYESEKRGKAPRLAPGRATLVGLFASVLLLGLGMGCEAPEPEAEVELERVDSVLAELGGTLMSRMERGQRWRMIASVGVGLPPKQFTGEDLPEAGSRGAGLVQVYCIQCHWLPSPTMHSPEEWEIILPRMYLRAEQLENRMGGPLTTGMVGEVVMSGYETAAIPSEADADTLLAYMRRYGLETADAAELPPGSGRDLFVEKCSTCHETPAPGAHTVTGWERLVGQMQEYMEAMQLEPLPPQEVDRITAYLREHAAP